MSIECRVEYNDEVPNNERPLAVFIAAKRRVMREVRKFLRRVLQSLRFFRQDRRQAAAAPRSFAIYARFESDGSVQDIELSVGNVESSIGTVESCVGDEIDRESRVAYRQRRNAECRASRRAEAASAASLAIFARRI